MQIDSFDFGARLTRETDFWGVKSSPYCWSWNFSRPAISEVFISPNDQRAAQAAKYDVAPISSRANNMQIKFNIKQSEQVDSQVRPSFSSSWKSLTFAFLRSTSGKSIQELREEPNNGCEGDFDLSRFGPILPFLTIIFVGWTCLPIPEKCALYNSFFSIGTLRSPCTSSQKTGEHKTALGEVVSL